MTTFPISRSITQAQSATVSPQLYHGSLWYFDDGSRWDAGHIWLGPVYVVSGATTQPQILRLGQQIGATRSLSQAQTVGLTTTSTFRRMLAATQAQVVAFQKQSRLPRSITQAQSLSIVPQRVALLVLSTSVAQSLRLSRAITLTRTALQAQVASPRLAVSITRSAASVAEVLAVRQSLLQVRTAAQAQVAMLQQQPRLARLAVQSQALSIAPQKVFLRTVSTTQAQTVALSTAVRHTYSLVASVLQAQTLSLFGIVTRPAPPPAPVVVPSHAPPTGTATSNYLDWPELIVTPTGERIGG